MTRRRTGGGVNFGQSAVASVQADMREKNMTAHRDETESSFFVFGHRAIKACIALDDPRLMDGSAFLTEFPIRKSWTVCEHLSTPEKAWAYQQETSPVLIVHGFILCQACSNRNLLTGQEGFNAMLRFSIPQDDLFFNRYIMKHEVPDDFCHRARLSQGTLNPSEKRRRVCKHLNTSQKLLDHYASQKTLYWQKDILLCADCLDEVKNGDGDGVHDHGLLLPERLFSEQVVAPLCLLNNARFGLQG
jgi:hypothetical protein